MNESGNKELEQIPPELENIVQKFEQLSLKPAPTLPSFVVSKQSSNHFLDIEQASKGQKKKSSMAVRIGKGGVGRRTGTPVANAEVLETMKQIQARLGEIELGHQRDPKDVSEPEAEEEEENVELTPDMRFFKSVLGSTSRPRLEVSSFVRGLNP